MEDNTIPYFVIYSGEYKVFRTKLSSDEILQVIDKVSDISVLGISDIEFQNEYQELYFQKLLKHYKKNLKAYQAKVENGKKGGRPRKNHTTNSTNPTEEVVGGETPPSPPITYDITCNNNIEKCFSIYSEECKDLKPIKYERRSRDVLELVAQFLAETSCDFEYFKEVCIKANEQKTLCDNALDFKSVVKNHISINNEKFKKNEKGTVVSKLKFK